MHVITWTSFDGVECERRVPHLHQAIELIERLKTIGIKSTHIFEE